MSAQIELSWPAQALSPNARSRTHWKRTRAIKAARAEAWGATKAVLPPCFKHNGTRVRFLITAYPPDKRSRDDDNIKSSLKAARDGIAEAMGIDDSLFDERFQWGEPCRGGKIIVTIG
jgi:crossover junction endodeoxyribonuclease RusA